MLGHMAETDTGDFPLKRHLGMTIRTLEPGHAEAAITIDERHLNPNGVAHGSVVFAMVDTAMGAAVMGLVPDGKVCTTTDIHVRFARPIFGGRLVADTVVTKPGRTLMHIESKVTNSEGKLVATATGAFLVIDAAAPTR